MRALNRKDNCVKGLRKVSMAMVYTYLHFKEFYDFMAGLFESLCKTHQLSVLYPLFYRENALLF